MTRFIKTRMDKKKGSANATSKSSQKEKPLKEADSMDKTISKIEKSLKRLSKKVSEIISRKQG